jgi:hypothetical protein
VIFTVVTAGYLVTLITNEQSLINTLIGLGITALGLPFYVYWKRRKGEGGG